MALSTLVLALAGCDIVQVAAQTSPTACSSSCTKLFDACIDFNTKGLAACRTMSVSAAYSTCDSYYGNYLNTTCKLDLISCVSKCK